MDLVGIRRIDFRVDSVGNVHVSDKDAEAAGSRLVIDLDN